MDAGSLYLIITVSVAFCVAAATAWWVHRQKRLNTTKKIHPAVVYCIMITGKDDDRIKRFAPISITNFVEQDYVQKRLLIFNHHSYLSVLDQEDTASQKYTNVFEFRVNKNENTLGDIRNIALEHVPADALWTLWDDDDVRSPGYLSFLVNTIRDNEAVCVSLTQRFEHNLRTGFTWKAIRTTGYPIVMARPDRRVRYKSVDMMEDVDLLKDYASIGKTVFIRNDPFMYVRIVHENNTSLYVNRDKRAIANMSRLSPYREEEASTDEAVRVENIISDFVKS